MSVDESGNFNIEYLIEIKTPYNEYLQGKISTTPNKSIFGEITNSESGLVNIIGTIPVNSRKTIQLGFLDTSKNEFTVMELIKTNSKDEKSKVSTYNVTKSYSLDSIQVSSETKDIITNDNDREKESIIRGLFRKLSQYHEVFPTKKINTRNISATFYESARRVERR
jgi:hypothetical protein